MTSSELDKLYKEIILDHHADPRNYGELPSADCKAEGYNPMCGDQVCVMLKFSPDRRAVVDQKFTGSACSICMASASIMTEEITGLPVADVLKKLRNFREVLQSQVSEEEIEGDLAALVGVKRFPVRIKCALLPWTTLGDALEKGCAAVRDLTKKKLSKGDCE